MEPMLVPTAVNPGLPAAAGPVAKPPTDADAGEAGATAAGGSALPPRFRALLAAQLLAGDTPAPAPAAGGDAADPAAPTAVADATAAAPLDPAALLALPPGLLPPGAGVPPPTATPVQADGAPAGDDATLAAGGRRDPALAAALPGAARGADAPQAAVDTPVPAAGMTAAARAGAERFGLPDTTLPVAGEKARGAESPNLPAALAAAAPPAPAPAPAPAVAALANPVGTPAWNGELGQKIVWMVGEKQHVAELHVNPPELGPLDIKLTVDGTQTSAVFTSPHGAVREAVESALPRLREVLAESGLQLGNASVTADSPRDGNASGGERGNGRRGNRDAAPPAAAAALPARLSTTTRGLVDLFA